MRFVGAGRQPHVAGKMPQAVGFALRIYCPQIPYDGAGPRIQDPGRGGPGGLLIVLPVRVVPGAEPVRPWFSARCGDRDFLLGRQHEHAHPMLSGSEVVNVYNLHLCEDEQQREVHGAHNGRLEPRVST